ncbi:helix-turn-helix domain-containing protein [Ligilactobacillus animalis]|uniref:Transcriptional regulator, y4mF family n=1 Tax=Ligilactobacillus animalis TaxID=1605 RepID=A0ABR4RPX2_9LACO|nr:helix-turn-helix domain-containing protein [Ligilactobacillus animalis]KDA46145.1 transcriptional regulator, y4mF family [Ligilactobacillus animalis]MEE0261065.1 helix-turn-helix domain-containing protein [Ligilactobacillus animalis]PNQ52954.1 XRE family transcriptional regulator [Ligilactobacillus animalis]
MKQETSSDDRLRNNIINLRESRNLSQSELAKLMGIHNSYISKIESGTRKVSTSELNKLAEIFDVSTDYLLGRKENESSTENQENKDLKKFLEDNLDNGMTFGDGEVTEEDREKLEIALTQIFYRYHDEFKKRKEEKGGFKF